MKKKDYVRDVDGREFYLGDINPSDTFNRIEITLSHLFRERTAILNNRNYSDCFWDFINKHGFFRPRVVEIGCGLGDFAFNLLNKAKGQESSFDSYLLYDISPELLKSEKRRMEGHSCAQFLESDCLELSRHINTFDGLILSNGMIADLRVILCHEISRL